MTDVPTIKICGLTTEAALAAALDGGANMVGFVFFAPSPRHLEFDRARSLGNRVQGRARKVALTVDASDEFLAGVVAALGPDLLQLHGQESPQRVAQLRQSYGLPVIKALGVASAADLSQIAVYDGVADFLLFDAKPDAGATRPGGNGRVFDWPLLKQARSRKPWLLSGGLTADNVLEAVAHSGAPGVDVSSGVESAPGVKDPEAIKRFIEQARRAGASSFG